MIITVLLRRLRQKDHLELKISTEWHSVSKSRANQPTKVHAYCLMEEVKSCKLLNIQMPFWCSRLYLCLCMCGIYHYLLCFISWSYLMYRIEVAFSSFSLRQAALTMHLGWPGTQRSAYSTSWVNPPGIKGVCHPVWHNLFKHTSIILPWAKIIHKSQQRIHIM